MATVEHDVQARRFTTRVDGYEGFLDYTLAEKVMTITHTIVPGAIGGRGVAADLMRTALKTAEESGWKVEPECSYAAAYMRRHP